MARSVVGYIKKYLNASATASPTQSVEATTGLPIQTGINAGVFQEFSDSEAAAYASKQVNAIYILTAGSGQTPGTYSVTASAGGATISVVVAAGGTVTAIPTVTNGGVYATDTTPTFTLTGTGGTPATFAANLGYLYSGVYAFAALDPAVTGAALPVGTPLYWLESSTSPIVTTVATANYPDFAGWTIDPNFGPALPYAFIQMNGKGKLLFGASGFPATFGNLVGLAASPGATFTDNTTTPTATTLGIALAVGTTLTTATCRVTKYPSRY